MLLWLGRLPSRVQDANLPAPAAVAGPARSPVSTRAVSSMHLARGGEGRLSRDAELEDAFLSRVAAAGALDDISERSLALQTLAEGLSSEEGYRLLTWLAVVQPPSDLQEFATLLLHRLADADVSRLEQWARCLPENRLRREAFATVALERSEADGAAAGAWARSLGSAPSEVAAVIQVATELTRSAPADALDLAARLPASPLRDGCLAHAVAQWAVAEPAEAAAWAQRIDDDALRGRLLSRVVTAMAVEDPWTAAEWTASALPQGPVQVGAAVAVAQRWAQRDPGAARSWVGTFPDDRLRKDALAAMEQATTRQDPSETAAGD